MKEIITIANQKGGVGKSTTAHALGSCLRARGERVLFVDLDPQGNLSMSLGIPFPDEEPATVAELLLSQLQNLSGCEISPQYVKHQYGVDFIVGNDNLGNVDRMLPG